MATTVNKTHLARSNADRLRREADVFLEDTQLLEVLSKYGELVLGGSYAYDVMVDEDIDIAIVLPKEEITQIIRAEVANTLLSYPNLHKFQMVDYATFFEKGKPDGIGFNARFRHGDSIWNCDIWLVDPDDPHSHINFKLHEELRTASKEDRDVIVAIKAELHRRGLRQKRLTASDIYRAVLEENIKSVNEYLKSRNIDIKAIK